MYCSSRSGPGTGSLGAALLSETVQSACLHAETQRNIGPACIVASRLRGRCSNCVASIHARGQPGWGNPSSGYSSSSSFSSCPIFDAIFSREGCPTSPTFSFRYTLQPRTVNRAQDSVPSPRLRRQRQHFRLIPGPFSQTQSMLIARRSSHSLFSLPPPQMVTHASSACRSAQISVL